MTRRDITSNPEIPHMPALNFMKHLAPLVEQGIKAISAHDGPAAMVFIRETNPSAITERFGATPVDPPHAQEARRLREYGVGAQILLDLGVRRMILLSTAPQKIVGLEGYGLEVIEQREIEGHDDGGQRPRGHFDQ